MLNEVPITPIWLDIIFKSCNSSVGKVMEQLKFTNTLRDSVNAGTI